MQRELNVHSSKKWTHPMLIEILDVRCTLQFRKLGFEGSKFYSKTHSNPSRKFMLKSHSKCLWPYLENLCMNIDQH